MITYSSGRKGPGGVMIVEELINWLQKCPPHAHVLKPHCSYHGLEDVTNVVLQTVLLNSNKWQYGPHDAQITYFESDRYYMMDGVILLGTHDREDLQMYSSGHRMTEATTRPLPRRTHEEEKLFEEFLEYRKTHPIKPLSAEEKAEQEERVRLLGEELCSNIRSHRPEDE